MKKLKNMKPVTNFKQCILIPIYSLLLLIFCFNTQSTQAQYNERLKEIPLWNNLPPDGPGPQGPEIVSEKGSITNVSHPRLIIHYPEHPNGTAILVISDGGYAHIEAGNESTPTANWLVSQGITAFELIYRLPGEGWATSYVAFQDGQRGMRLIRSMAQKMGIDTHRIGIMGFSAGGHLTAMTETEPNKQYYTPVDAIDRLSARADFAALLYPIITICSAAI